MLRTVEVTELLLRFCQFNLLSLISFLSRKVETSIYKKPNDLSKN